MEPGLRLSSALLAESRVVRWSAVPSSSASCRLHEHEPACHTLCISSPYLQIWAVTLLVHEHGLILRKYMPSCVTS